ncbi:MAG: formylglycine-generating enzyme family protein, partial [Lentisphaerae bacterium]|nr:formylglycine-generating enzyme family protein [Lentisphaerota bacterium]
KIYHWPYEYTENHTLNILVARYLINHILGRDTTSALGLLESFFDDRVKMGWSEFNSPKYASTSLKALSVLSDFSPDAWLRLYAKTHIDFYMTHFAVISQGLWRAIPATRAGMNRYAPSRDSFNELAWLWFGDSHGDIQKTLGFIVHFLTSNYEPPSIAIWLMKNLERRGTYEAHQLATTGPGKERVPIVFWVTPYFTLSSAQGGGAYYDGLYGAMLFASSPHNYVVFRYENSRNMFQSKKLMVTFGSVDIYGDLSITRNKNVVLASDGSAHLAYLDLGDDCKVVLTGDKSEYPTPEDLFTDLVKLDASFSNGVVRLKSLADEKIAMFNEQTQGKWIMSRVERDGELMRIDKNMLFDSPYLRSERESGVVETFFDGSKKVFDFRQSRQISTNVSKSDGLESIRPDFWDGPLNMRFVYVPAGEFLMGSPVDEGRRNERPQQWVFQDHFMISETEVTMGQYKVFLAECDKARPLPDWLMEDKMRGDEHPVVWVSWGDASLFCEWLSEKTGEKFALPTEMQWEKTAKGYSHRKYPWGDSYDGSQSGNQNRVYLPGRSKTLDRSPFGSYDMAGNVWEWCRNLYVDDLNSLVSGGMGGVGDRRSLRGCGWNYDPDTFRTSYRSFSDPELRSIHIGFRIVREIGVE